MIMSRRAARKFSDAFKQQMVQLYHSGKPSGEMIKEYDLTTSTFHDWVKKYNTSGSFEQQITSLQNKKNGLLCVNATSNWRWR